MSITHSLVNSLRTRRNRLGLYIGAVLVSLICVSSFHPAQAGPTYASVDLAKVFNGCNDKTKADAELEASTSSLRNAFDVLQKNTILTSEKISQLSKILQKKSADLTETDKTNEKALLDEAKSESNELATLQQKKDPAAADSLRLQQLSQQQVDGSETLKAIYKDFSTELDNRKAELNQQIAGKMKEAIATVAQKQGISVVFDSTVAVYTSTDITKDVLAVLNK